MNVYQGGRASRQSTAESSERRRILSDMMSRVITNLQEHDRGTSEAAASGSNPRKILPLFDRAVYLVIEGCVGWRVCEEGAE